MTINEMLLEEAKFDKMNFEFDFDKFNASMAQIRGGTLSGANVYGALAPLTKAVQQIQAEINDLKKHGGAHLGVGDNQAVIQQIMAESDMINYIAISRATKNITASNTVGNLYVAGQPAPLPFVLWAFNDRSANYVSSLKNFQVNLQAACPGASYSVAVTGTGNQTWTWTYSNNTDIVTIYYPGTLTSYNNMVSNQSQDSTSFYCRYILYSISDATNGLSQVTSGDIQFIDISNGGSQNNAEILVNGSKMTWDYQNDRINMLFPEQHFNANKAIVDSIIGTPAADVTAGVPFVITYTMYCSKHEAYNRKK